MDHEIRDFPPTRVVGRRHLGPYPQIGRAFEELFSRLTDVPVVGPPIAIFYDDPHDVPESDLRSDAAAPVPADFEASPEGLHIVDMPPGKYAVHLHRGSYEGLPGAWKEFESGALPAAGITPREGLCFERYLNDCSQVPPAELLTEIWVPVR